MKLKVLKEFQDKYTLEIYKENSVIELSTERAKEVIESIPDYVSEIKEKKIEKK